MLFLCCERDDYPWTMVIIMSVIAGPVLVNPGPDLVHTSNLVTT
jgi:hypothetical protein